MLVGLFSKKITPRLITVGYSDLSKPGLDRCLGFESCREIDNQLPKGVVMCQGMFLKRRVVMWCGLISCKTIGTECGLQLLCNIKLDNYQ